MGQSNKKLKAIDFFCSAGGVTCGFKAAGIDVLGGIDIDENCKETYEKNNDAKFLTADVSNLDKAALTKEFGYKNIMQVPKLEKIVISKGVGAAVADKKLIDYAVDELTTITWSGESKSVMLLLAKKAANRPN